MQLIGDIVPSLERDVALILQAEEMKMSFIAIVLGWRLLSQKHILNLVHHHG